MKRKELYRSSNMTVNDAFDRLAVNIHLKKQQNGYKSFLLCGCEPSVGTTTISIDLAISMATAGWKTILIDCDMRKNADFKRLNEQSEGGLYEFLSGNVPMKDIFCQTNYDHLTYVPNGNGRGGQVALLCSAKMQEFIIALKEEYDYVIIEAPTLASAVDGIILAPLVDGVVIITSQGDSSKSMIVKTKDQLEKSGANILGVVINKMDKVGYKKNMRNYDYFQKVKYAKKRNVKKAVQKAEGK